MRERWIDVALMLGLFLVAGIIVWTLFGAPKPKLQSASTPQQVTPTEVAPVTPINLDNDNAEVISPVSPDAITPDTITIVEPNNQETGSIEDAVIEEVETQEVETLEIETLSTPLPAGTLELNRIGFSYVTGGPGACGVILEPWEHVAVSRDILEKYPCGSSISIALDKNTAGRDSFTAIVGDTMSSIHSLTVNVYVGTDEPALNYGIRDGKLIP